MDRKSYYGSQTVHIPDHLNGDSSVRYEHVIRSVVPLDLDNGLSDAHKGTCVVFGRLCTVERENTLTTDWQVTDINPMPE